MQVCRKIIIPGEPRVFDNATAAKTFRSKPHKRFGAINIRNSPFIANHPGEMSIQPLEWIFAYDKDDFEFELTINGKKAGTWTLGMVAGPPPFWKEAPVKHHLQGYEFRMKPQFRWSNNPGNWYAAAFRRAVQKEYLSPTFPGWILTANTEKAAMNRVFAAAHGMARLVQHSQSSWEVHAFMDPLAEVPTRSPSPDIPTPV